jgi:hypothetical protein
MKSQANRVRCHWLHSTRWFFLIGLVLVRALGQENATGLEAKRATLDATVEGDRAKFAVQAEFHGGESRLPTLWGAVLEESIQASRERLDYKFNIEARAIQGSLRELIFLLGGEGEIREVTGDGVEDWSVRQGSGGSGRSLIVRFVKGEKAISKVSFGVRAESKLATNPEPDRPGTNGGFPALTLNCEKTALATGFIHVTPAEGVEVVVGQSAGLVPISITNLPSSMRPVVTNRVAELAFRFLGTAYTLPLTVRAADPDLARVVLQDFKLVGQLGDETADFTLTARARIQNPEGAAVELLSGRVALIDSAMGADSHLSFQDGAYQARFDKPGEYPIQIRFKAAIRLTNDWREVEFAVAPSVLQPVVFRGLREGTQFRFSGAAKPERSGDEFTSFLPSTGEVSLGWKERGREAEGALFFSAEQLSQVIISPGMMRQVALIGFKVMQGEMARATLRLKGEGEVTRVQGDGVLSWKIEPVSRSSDRLLEIQFNQAQRDRILVQIQTQTSLASFPASFPVVQIQPDAATRFTGYVRILNEGAVRLEVSDSEGLSQISPEQFPKTEGAAAVVPINGTQVFAYRFSGSEYQLRVQADNILPELAISEILAYRLGENELSIDGDFEIEVREAPLRELQLRIPRGYLVAKLEASGMSDYFLTDIPESNDAQLRVVYGAPVVGRQLVQLHLERNSGLGSSNWALPRPEVLQAKSTRGHVGITTDEGLRITPGQMAGLTEIAPAFFPKKLVNLQAAFRLSDPGWRASVTVERLPQSIQADVFHLFSVGEGIAYGSTVMNYLISGVPVPAFRVALTNEYFNVEFTGKDVRSWQKTEGGYLVQLNSPASGAYTLLATYERPFKAQGENLRFVGAQPLDAQTEQGHTILVSTHQFQVRTTSVSSGLIALEPGEVPAEFRLFFDAPILAAYRYNSRPFDLQLELKPLQQSETVAQLVERSSLSTRISREGQVVTDARYFIKNRGMPNLRIRLQDGDELWSVLVDGQRVVPVKADGAELIALPSKADPNAVTELQVKVATAGRKQGSIRLFAPKISAPVLLTEWTVDPEPGQRVVFRRGTISPAGGSIDQSGYAQFLRFLRTNGGGFWRFAGTATGFFVLALLVSRLATERGSHRYGIRHLMGGVLAIGGSAIALYRLVQLGVLSQAMAVKPPTGLRFLVPIQPADSVFQIEVGAGRSSISIWTWVWALWPLLLALELFRRSGQRREGRAIGWVGLCWAALRAPDGAPALFAVGGLFVVFEFLIPGIRRWNNVPRSPGSDSASGPAGAGAVVTAVVIIGLIFGFPLETRAAETLTTESGIPTNGGDAVAESVTQEIRIAEDYARVLVRIQWQARVGESLNLLHGGGVLTRIKFPGDAGRLVERVGADGAGSRGRAMLAVRSGLMEIELEYQLPVSVRDGEQGITLPTARGLVNRVDLSFANLDVDVSSPQSVSVLRLGTSLGGSRFELVLTPTEDAWIGWRPKTRDPRAEKAVFYVELSQLYVPAGGVIEGIHQVQIRPAQGELAEINFAVPSGLTIVDVSAPALNVWRFDPVSRILRVLFNNGQSRPFVVLVKSQSPAHPLPYQQTVGLLSVEGAAGQSGSIGVATGTEVQLEAVEAGGMSGMNLEDYPGAMLEPLQGSVAGLTLRRAYRYSETGGSLKLKVSAVEADIRVESQQTVSVGEDRVLLAANLNLAISRAGIFKLSFVMPPGFDVESIGGAAVSHWTELKAGNDRLITLHLKSRTEGAQAMAVTLTGPGMRATNGWVVPRVALREAGKQRGQLLVASEQGLRPQVRSREGLTQLDPVQAGVRQKGVLAFRLLQGDWKLALDIERVDAWTQVTSLQQVTVGEALLRVVANLQYEIENAGLKALKVRLPASADGVQFRGDLVSDFVKGTVLPNGEGTDWEVRLSRRAAGKVWVQLSYTQGIAEKATNVALRGVEALEVNLQRGYVTVQSANRLQARFAEIPATLQSAEWQSIPRALQRDLHSRAADYSFRLVEPHFEARLNLERYEAARLLPARVSSVALTSVVSDDGEILTRAIVTMIPGDKQLLHLTLPVQSRFWFAFVGQNSVWPWREGDQILIPLEQHSRTSEPTTVEFLYSGRAGVAGGGRLDLGLSGPRFDLPLENIQWRVFLGRKWRIAETGGTLQEQGGSVVADVTPVDLDSYIRNEAGARQQQIREAEQFLNTGNSLLVQGNPEQARRAFQNAYGLSQNDVAFNEDARVQLHNLKTQQAMVGLNVRQAKISGANGGGVGVQNNLRNGLTQNYTQKEAKELIERNTADENGVQLRLVERLVQQQEAVEVQPAPLRTMVPEQGQVLTFTRSMQVETNTVMDVRISAREIRAAGFGSRMMVLGSVLGVVVAFLGLVRYLGPGGLTKETSHGTPV